MIIHKLTYEYEEPDYPEVFRIINYPGIAWFIYEISNHGRVRIRKTGKILKSFFDKDGHERITLQGLDLKSNGEIIRKHAYIHRLMMWAFVGPPPDELHCVVSHKNEIPCCNFIHNLEWASVLENTNHAKLFGRFQNSGIKSSNVVHSEKLIRKICKYFEEGYTNIEIFELITGSKIYKKTKNYKIYNLINKLSKRMYFRDIVTDYDYAPPIEFFKCTKDIADIRFMIYDGKTNYEILAYYGYKEPSENKDLYNKIIYERQKCEVLFNDYPKEVLDKFLPNMCN